MALFKLLGILLLGCVAAKACKEGEMTSNPVDCGSYFICDNGNFVLMVCPPGLEWNQNVLVCDLPENANCVVSSSVEPTEGTTESTTEGTTQSTTEEITQSTTEEITQSTTEGTTEGPTETTSASSTESCVNDELYPNPSDCSTFYICDRGNLVLMKCPPDQEWWNEEKRCDLPENANCVEDGSSAQPTESTQAPTGSTETTTRDPNACIDDELFPNPEDCGTYFICDRGNIVLMKCPPGQEWWTEMERCDYPEFANCVEGESPTKPEDPTESTTKATQEPTQSTTDNSVSCEEGEVFGNPEDCASYFICNYGKLVLMYCPSGLEWNDAAKLCDFPENANCVETS